MITRTVGSRRWARLVATAALAAAGCAAEVGDETGSLREAQGTLDVAQVPDSLAVPEGARHAFTLVGRGDQVYQCAEGADGGGRYEWTFVEPRAKLFTRHGRPAGVHYAGPTWEAAHGGSVVAARVAGETVDPSAIPWLLLRATSHEGKGPMSRVTYIQRLATTGGLAPETGCDQAHVGARLAVPYRADYVFYE